MKRLNDKDIIPCLKKSDYYKVFSKTFDDGIILQVPLEYVIINYELELISNYEEHFNILIKFDFYQLPYIEYPNW
jgi:hypothetical protein